MQDKLLENATVSDAIKVEKIEEKTEKTVEKAEKTEKKHVKIKRNEYIGIIMSYIHPNFSIFETIENVTQCKICGKSLNMAEKTICPECFWKNNKYLYEQFGLNEKEEVKLEV